jgi:hypothetical protein
VTGLPAHRYIRAYLAGVALPTLVVCAAGLLIVGVFDRLDISVQRALILPLATNPLIWGVWNVAWVALGPQRRALIGWYGVLLAVLLIGVGLLVARRLDVSGITLREGAAALVPIGIAYYVLWRYGVSFLNSVVGLDARGDRAARRTA